MAENEQKTIWPSGHIEVTIKPPLKCSLLVQILSIISVTRCCNKIFPQIFPQSCKFLLWKIAKYLG